MALNGNGFSADELLRLWESGSQNKLQKKFVGFIATKKISSNNSTEIKSNPNSSVKNLKVLPKTITANKMNLSTREANKIGLETINNDSNKANISVSQINIDKKPIPIQTEEAYKKPAKPETVPFSKLIERKPVRPNQSNKIYPQNFSQKSESENSTSTLIQDENKMDIKDMDRPLSSPSI